jgi:hypothetical protein
VCAACSSQRRKANSLSWRLSVKSNAAPHPLYFFYRAKKVGDANTDAQAEINAHERKLTLEYEGEEARRKGQNLKLIEENS